MISKILNYLKSIHKTYSPSINYCINCGACCSLYVVRFNKNEINPINSQFVEFYNKKEVVMKGTKKYNTSSCVCLKGEIGKNVFCSIYEHRPNVCRQFNPLTKNNTQNPRCRKARKKLGLHPDLDCP